MVIVMILSMMALVGFVVTCYIMKEGRSIYRNEHEGKDDKKLGHNSLN